MHVNCSKDELLYAVQVVSRAVSSKNTMPVLGGILLKAENNILNFRATDLEIAVECSIPVEVVEPGIRVIPGRYFAEIVKKLPSGPLNIRGNSSMGLEIRYEQSELSINGYDPDEFPSFPELQGDFSGHMDQDLFKAMIKQVSVAASSDETRPVFTGVLMEIQDNQVTMVATDTHRLAMRTGVWKGPAQQEKVSMIIPSRTMVEVARVVGDLPDPLYIMPGSNQVYFRSGEITIISRLIDGQYPIYRQVIPDQDRFKTKIRVRTKKLLEAVERAALLSRDDLKEKSNLIRIRAEGEIISINSNSPEIGKIYEEVPIYLEGEGLEIVFNSRYLMDALKVVDVEEIYLQLTGALSPGIITGVDHGEYLYLILPVRTA